MKILHVLRTPVGGLFRHVRDLAAAQAARGHSVGVLYDSSTGDGLASDRLAALGDACALGVHGVAISRALSPRDLGGLMAARRLARDLDVDILHGHGAKGGAFARLAGALAGVVSAPASQRPRVFYTPHGGSLHYDPRSVAGRVFLGMERHLERWTDGLIFESAFSARSYEAKVGAPRTASRVVHNGLQPSELTLVQPVADAADFVFVGELRHLKGVDVLLQALARIETKSPRTGQAATAVFVGDGPEAQTFRDLAERLGLGSRVRFVGALPARTAFALGRTLVVPSRAESFPYIVLEAAAAGRPLIVTDVGGIPEILAGSGVGMIPADDVAALATAMCAAVARPLDIAAGATRLRARMAERFTVAAMTDAVLDFYGAAPQAARALAAQRSLL